MIRDHYDMLIDQLLREVMGGDRPRDMTGRVLAQAKLIDGFRRRRWILSGLAAAASLALVAGLWMAWPRDYPAPFGEGVEVVDGAKLQRGAIVQTNEVEGGKVNLGNYVDISMDPQTALSIGGARYQERVVLYRGGLNVSVRKNRGKFDVEVGEATVHVVGTEFTVNVADELQEATSVRKMRVSVREGRVEVQGLGAGPLPIQAGDSRDFVLSTAPRVLPRRERAGPGLLSAAQEGARAGNRGGVASRLIDGIAGPGRAAVATTNRTTTTAAPAITTTTATTVTGRGSIVVTAPGTGPRGAPQTVQMITVEGGTRAGRLRSIMDVFYLETPEGNFFLFLRPMPGTPHSEWLSIPLGQTVRVTWNAGQVTVLQPGNAPPPR